LFNKPEIINEPSVPLHEEVFVVFTVKDGSIAGSDKM